MKNTFLLAIPSYIFSSNLTWCLVQHLVKLQYASSKLCCCSVLFCVNTSVNTTLTLCWLSPDLLQVFWTFHLLTWALKRATCSESTLCTPGSCTAAGCRTKVRGNASQNSRTAWSLSARSARSPHSHPAAVSSNCPGSINLCGVLFLQNTTKKYTCRNQSCSAELRLHTPQETHCVKVHGEMTEMAVRGKHKYCMAPVVTPKKTSWVVYVLLLFVFVHRKSKSRVPHTSVLKRK